ncbi:MAG: SDR family oxidoreductase [Lentisphaerae bacterium]|nr:MAG: SDR family oxidoreductase [Lentisphaerota bacterium]
MDFNFSGKHVLVTGGTRGIGAAISKAFLEAGASVCACYAANREAADRFCSELDKASRERLECVQLDIADYESVERFFNDRMERSMEFDIVVNNAGIRRDGLLAMMEPEDWHRVIAVNLDGVFHVCRFAVMQMLPKRWGRIINITSPSGRLGFAGQANYAAAKAGIVGLSRSLALEVGRRGVTVNCVCPGFIDTELIADLPDEQRRSYQQSVPLKRFGKVGEVASVVMFLASQEAGYITGSVYDVTGGI